MARSKRGKSNKGNIKFEKLSKSKATPRKDKCDFAELEAGFSPGLIVNRSRKTEPSLKKKLDQKKKKSTKVSVDASTVKKVRDIPRCDPSSQSSTSHDKKRSSSSSDFSSEPLSSQKRRKVTPKIRKQPTLPSTVKRSSNQQNLTNSAPETPSHTVEKSMRQVLEEIIETEMHNLKGPPETVAALKAAGEDIIQILPTIFARGLDEEYKRIEKEQLKRVALESNSNTQKGIRNQRLLLKEQRLQELLNEFTKEEQEWERVIETWRNTIVSKVEEDNLSDTEGDAMPTPKVSNTTQLTGKMLMQVDTLQRTLCAADSCMMELKRNKDQLTEKFRDHTAEKFQQNKTPRRLIRGMLG